MPGVVNPGLRAACPGLSHFAPLGLGAWGNAFKDSPHQESAGNYHGFTDFADYTDFQRVALRCRVQQGSVFPQVPAFLL